MSNLGFNERTLSKFEDLIVVYSPKIENMTKFLLEHFKDDNFGKKKQAKN